MIGQANRQASDVVTAMELPQAASEPRLPQPERRGRETRYMPVPGPECLGHASSSSCRCGPALRVALAVMPVWCHCDPERLPRTPSHSAQRSVCVSRPRVRAAGSLAGTGPARGRRGACWFNGTPSHSFQFQPRSWHVMSPTVIRPLGAGSTRDLNFAAESLLRSV